MYWRQEKHPHRAESHMRAVILRSHPLIQETGEITVHKAGEVTITLRAEQTDIYEAAEAEYKLIVTHKFSDEWKYDDKEHWKECVCGEKSEVGAHSGGKADTVHKAKCSVCGTEYGE